MKLTQHELVLRTVSGVVLAIAALFITWWHPMSFAAMCLIGGIIIAREWWGLTKQRSRWFILLGTLYIGAAMGSLIFLRLVSQNLIYELFALVWAGDIGGYVVGKLMGRHKLAPSISPGKSWEGLVGSILITSATLAGIMIIEQSVIAPQGWWIIVVVGSMFAVAGLLGDLFESALKRRAGVKDSGRLIPGHGGLFDRVDALMACAILFVLLLLVSILLTALHGAPVAS